MKITSVFSDVYYLLRALLAGEPIDVICGGEIWALCILITAAVSYMLYKKQRLGGIKAFLSGLAVTAYSYYYIGVIAPIAFDDKGQPLGSIEGTYFSIFWKPFYAFTSVGQVFRVYWGDMVFFFVIGFAFTAVFRFAYKLQLFSVFAVGSMVFYIAVILIEDLVFGGVVDMVDLSLPIVCLPMMFIGWGLARLVIHLNSKIYDHIQRLEQAEAA